jgi:hypothetical protein
MIKKLVLVSILTASATFVFSQNQKEEDETRMVREVISVQVDKSQFAAPATPPPTAAETPGKKGKKPAEVPPPAEAAPDTSSPMIPAPASEIAKRAQSWTGDKPTANKYSKKNCANNGNGVTCQVSFLYKLKELNPTDKVEGEITMTVTIEAKEGKYRYTINNIRHKATVGENSGGDIYATIPECGSMRIADLSWKHIKAAAFADTKIVADDLKAKMAQSSGDTPKKGDW